MCPLPSPLPDCPTEDSARIELIHDSPGVGAACHDHCDRVVEGKWGVPHVSWHMVSQEEGCGWWSTSLPLELGYSNTEDLIFGTPGLKGTQSWPLVMVLTLGDLNGHIPPPGTPPVEE